MVFAITGLTSGSPSAPFSRLVFLMHLPIWSPGSSYSPMTVRTAVIKTISNSWCTSSRYHEAIVHHCIFGCNACCPRPENAVFLDQLSHYLVCPRLWSLIARVSGLPVGSSACSRVGVSMEWIDLPLIALAHHIYHSLKLGNMLGTRTTYSRWSRVIHAAEVDAKIAKIELFVN